MASASPARPGRLRNVLRGAGQRIGLGRILALLLLAGMTAIRIWDPLPVEALRLRVTDFYQRIKPYEPPRTPDGKQVPPKVMIVDIDAASLREIGQWPWPRSTVAELVRAVGAQGASVIGFDIVFAEPDRTSPAVFAATITDPALREALSKLPSNDALLAQSFRAVRTVLGQSGIHAREGEIAGETAEAADISWPTTGFAMKGASPAPFLASYTSLLHNLPELEVAAAGRGVFSILPEQDGIIRRVPVVALVEGAPVPALSLDMLRVHNKAGAILVQADAAGVTQVAFPRRPDPIRVPTDARGRVWVYFAPSDLDTKAHPPDHQSRYVSARDLLTGRLAPDALKGKLVLVGTSATGLLDNKTTPVDDVIPGVEIHAEVLESMLSGIVLWSPNWMTAAELLLAGAVSLVLIVLAPLLGAVQLFAVGGALAALIAGLSWYLFSRHLVLMDPTYPLASSFAVYLTLLSTNYLSVQLDRGRIRSAFGQYLSPALVEQLAQSPEKLVLGGEQRRMTILFSDVRGFTTIAEGYKHDPQGLTSLMNRFLTPLTNAIIERKGTIDKYMGDAIMAFWNAPLDDADHEAHACEAALAMLSSLDDLNRQRRLEAEATGQAAVPIAVGVGLNTGLCVVGNMGSDLRFDYSVLGDAVNLASRLEGQSKSYGVQVIIGSATAEAVKDRFAVLEIDLITVKGKTEPERVFTLLGREDLLRSPKFRLLADLHQGMLAAYRAQNWDEAAAAVTTCRAAAEGLPLDGLYKIYEERIAAFREEPPPVDWDGVIALKTK